MQPSPVLEIGIAIRAAVFLLFDVKSAVIIILIT